MSGWSNIPGNKAYIELCRKAVEDDNVFQSFRRNPAYTTVLEHVTEAQALEYFGLLSTNTERHLYQASKNDLIGAPHTIPVHSDRLSPTTLRYLKVADQITRLFGNLDGYDVAEIGVGYGGQCRILSLFGALHSYTLLDLDDVTALALKFLFHFKADLPLLWDDDYWWAEYDLAISNYAFSELDRAAQEPYISTLQRSKHGYITFNKVSPASFNSMTPDEIREIVHGRVIPEDPLTHEGNCIIVWG